jgi:malonyl-CoA O-methyltransferase
MTAHKPDTGHKARIAARFGAAAGRYDTASDLQRTAAQRLAQRVRALRLPAAPRVLEIGCGTGHLTRELLPHIGGEWIVSDMALPMVRACRQQVAAAAGCVVMDGERPAFRPASFDLIVSSLTLQWFADLHGSLAALADLLAPGGRIALATLGAATFAEWRHAHRKLGLAAATPEYPDAKVLAQAFPATLETAVSAERIVVPAGDPLAFVRGLRAIGADTPRPGARPLTAGQLRRVLRVLAADGTPQMTYELLYACAENSAVPFR